MALRMKPGFQSLRSLAHLYTPKAQGLHQIDLYYKMALGIVFLIGL